MKRILSFTIIVLFFFTNLSISLAQNPPTIGLDAKKQPGGIQLTDNNPDQLLGDVFKNIIVLFFTVGGLGFVIMFVWGAVDWILSGGDKEKIAGARKRIVTAITGLVLLSLTFVIATILGQILGLATIRDWRFPIPTLNQR